MTLPTLQGLIRRRILVNFRVAPKVLRPLLPQPFQPQLLDGLALVGICLIRLEQVRPWPLPSALGMTSENCAHRMAVTWRTRTGEEQRGVYIPRRDTNSLLNHLAGGRLFPGEHHRADFSVVDAAGVIELSMTSHDRAVTLELSAHPAEQLPATSVFSSLEAASEFFKRGSVGYSPRAGSDRLDATTLATSHWQVRPLNVKRVRSSFFDNPDVFPRGSVTFDCALLMRDIPHQWHTAEPPVCTPALSESSGACSAPSR